MIKVEDEADQVLIAKVYRAGQEQVFRFWDSLDVRGREELLAQLRTIDFQELAALDRLRAEQLEGAAPADLGERPEPPPIVGLPTDEESVKERERALALGESLIAEGKVAAFVVAGGQGTRLGWDHPKGTYPVGPVSGKSLFQLFAEQLKRRAERAGRAIPWIILTSSGNAAETRDFFKEHGDFGLPEGTVRFIQQRDLPVVDQRGKMLLSGPSKIAFSPDGHGGSLTALRRSGALEELSRRGVEHIFYWQVDNPLCPVLDPVLLGYHADAQAEASSKVVAKTDPWEKVGVLGYIGPKLKVIEYSELDDDLRHARESENGPLRYRAGNIAVHVFRVDYLLEQTEDGVGLPYHLAHKVVPVVDKDGRTVRPEAPNGIKFERFVFDVLADTKVHVTQEVDRAEEFAPLKNGDGADSPETVRAAILERSRRWLEQAGHELAAGRPVEVSPGLALSPAGLAERLPEGWRAPDGDEPLHLDRESASESADQETS